MHLEPEKSQNEKRGQKQYHNMWGRLSLNRLGHWLKKEDNGQPPPSETSDQPPHSPEKEMFGGSRFLSRRGSRKSVPGLPRHITFRRQQSEMRDKLCPVDPDKEKGRARSEGRRPSGGDRRTLSPPPTVRLPSHSAPDVGSLMDVNTTAESLDVGDHYEEKSGYPEELDCRDPSLTDAEPPEPIFPVNVEGDVPDRETFSEGVDDHIIQQELEARWILNLSMHFRDLSDREKFFITYAEEPNKWRRVTVSCDYRDVVPDSLEADMKSLHYQRDKSARIYESIRDSLPDIQFYPTVTNLKLQTADGRLHVHVTEDLNEIIQYPPVSSVQHLPGPRFSESQVHFDSHISGFVYKVNVGEKVYIKKEIPGPDTVEEFLYEVNALYSLQDSKSVIKYEGLIEDDSGELIKGVLISFAEQGALVDIIFDWKDTPQLPWSRRERWAWQIIQGLSEIHEEGFVQGDFTLSNIVIDADDNAKIIDINRRGCPVGWESPELSKLIDAGHRISIYIGVKSDLFQLGMVLWALAAEQDEPERRERPLGWAEVASDVPDYFRRIVDICLSEKPRDRLDAKSLLALFPYNPEQHCSSPPLLSRQSVSTHRSDKEYIDPATAVELADIECNRHDRCGDPSRPSSISAEDLGFGESGLSTSYRFSSTGSFVVPKRGRSSACSVHGSTSVSASASRGRDSHYFSRSPAARVSSVSLGDSDLDTAFGHDQHTVSREPRWEQIYVDGDTKLVHRSSAGVEKENFSKPEQGIDYLSSLVANSPELERDEHKAIAMLSELQQEPPKAPSTDTLTPTTTTETIKGPETGMVSGDQERLHLPPIEPTLPFRGSFHERVHARRPHDSTLADLGEEFLKSSPKAKVREESHRGETGPSPTIEPLRHSDSGFHEDGSRVFAAPIRDSTFGPPLHTTSGFQASATRALDGSSRASTFGPPKHSDSGFQDFDPIFPELDLPAKPSIMESPISAPQLDRTNEDEQRVREAVRKILSGEFQPHSAQNEAASDPNVVVALDKR